MRFVKISKKELIAYFLVGIIFIVALIVTVMLSGEIRKTINAVSSEVIKKASFNISNGYAVVVATQYSEEEIALSIVESKKEVEETLANNNLPVIRDFTAEEEQLIMTGKVSAEDAVQILMSKNPETDYAINENQSSGSTVKSGISSSHSQDNADEIIGEKITKLYGLKAYYLGLLGNLFNEAKQEYDTIKKNGGNAKSIASKYMSKAAVLENECDSQVYGMLAELESKLKENGSDTSVISTIEQAYIKEKRLKKSYYLTKYKF